MHNRLHRSQMRRLKNATVFLAIAFRFSACCQGLSQTQTAFDVRGKTQTLHVFSEIERGLI